MKAFRSITAALLLAVVALVSTGSRQFDGTSQYVSVATAPVTALPMTIAAWVYADSTAAAMSIGMVGSAASTRCQIGFGSGGLPNAVTATTGGASVQAQSVTGLSANTWHHIVGTFTSSTDRKVFANGAQVGSNTSSSTIGTLDRVLVGARVNSSAVGLYWAGRIAEFAVWDITLSAADIASLAAGARPNRVRPGALRLYLPLVGQASPEQNLIGLSGTLTNAPTQVSHPRIY